MTGDLHFKVCTVVLRGGMTEDSSKGFWIVASAKLRDLDVSPHGAAAHDLSSEFASSSSVPSPLWIWVNFNAIVVPEFLNVPM